MMYRSSGELSSGLSGCGNRPRLGICRGVVSAYLRRACCGTASRALIYHIYLYAVSSHHLMYVSCMFSCRRTSELELLDCEIPVLVNLGGG